MAGNRVSETHPATAVAAHVGRADGSTATLTAPGASATGSRSGPRVRPGVGPVAVAVGVVPPLVAVVDEPRPHHSFQEDAPVLLGRLGDFPREGVRERSSQSSTRAEARTDRMAR
jgi:hypothetical protein